MTRLADDLLDVARIESGQLELERRVVDVRAIVAETVEARRAQIERRRHSLNVEIGADSILVDGDPVRLAQVVSNLVDNAAKYSPDRSCIQIIVDVHDEHVRFAVSDEGLGIPLNEQEQIFEKFYRLDPHHRRGVSGSGLGLYICRELVHSMNGRIFVESDLGRGATFTVELPVADRSPAPASRHPARA
jgi:signal transduction histidine kinase